LAAVAFPYRELDVGRDDAVVFEILRGVAQIGVGVVNEFELELEDAAPLASLSPCVDEAKDAVKRPDVGLDLLVDVDQLRLVAAITVALSGGGKETVLRQPTVSRVLRLIDRFRIWGLSRSLARSCAQAGGAAAATRDSTTSASSP
jgi:hypothetical protein